LFAATLFAWEGYDSKEGTDVDVQRGEDNTIEFYDYSDKSHCSAQIRGRHIDGTEIEVCDYQSGRNRTFRRKDASPEAREEFDTIEQQEFNRGDRHD